MHGDESSVRGRRAVGLVGSFGSCLVSQTRPFHLSDVSVCHRRQAAGHLPVWTVLDRLRRRRKTSPSGLYSGGPRNFENGGGGERLYQHRLSFIANARNELDVFCSGKGDMLKKLLSPIGGGAHPLPFEFATGSVTYDRLKSKSVNVTINYFKIFHNFQFLNISLAKKQ